MFTAKDGKKFGSSFAGKTYDEKHSPSGMHKLGGEEPHELGQDKVGEGAKKTSTSTPGEDVASKRRDATMSGKSPLGEDTADNSFDEQGEQKGMNMDEGSPEESSEPQESRTDEEGEAKYSDQVPDDVKAAVNDHGHASKIVVTHDKSTGRHAVASQHADGHMHQSMHKDAKSAHAAARHLGTPKEAPEPEDDEYSHLLG